MAFTINLAKNLPYPLFGVGSLVRKISLCATKSNPEVPKTFLKTCLRSASTVAPSTTAEETDNLVVDDWIEIADADRSKFKTLNEQIYTKESYLKYFSDYLNETETTLPSPVAFKMIKACGSQMSAEDEKTRNELALYAWEQLKKNGTPLGISMWNTLLSVFIENQHQFDPVYFLHQLRQETSLEPNQSTLSLLIQKYAIDGDTAGVMKIIEFMMEKNFAMTENKYAWLIQAFAKNGNFKGVENVLESMRENGIPPRHTTYKQIINAHARNGDLHSIDQTIKEMLGEKISPTAEMYADLLENLCLGGHLSLLETTLNRITDIETMQRRLRTLLQQCTLRGDYESAVVLVQFYMRQRKNRKFQFLHACGIALFNNLSHTNKGLEEFVKLSNTFERSLGVAENSRVAFLAEYCASNGKLGWAFELADKHATENEQKVYHQILKVLTFIKDSASIAKIFCHMMERNISPDYYCSRYVTQSLEKANNEELIRFLDNLKELENFEIHHNFINALLENEDITLSDLAKYIHLSINGNIVGAIKPITELIQRDFDDAEAFKIIKVLENKKINTEKMIERIMQTNTLIDADTTKKAYNLMVNVMQEGIATSKFSHFYMLKGLYTFLRIQEPQYFFSFVQIMKDHNIEPDVSQQILMLRMASKIGNPQAAEFCFDRIIISEELPAFYKENKQMLYQYLIESYQNEAFLNAKSKRSPNASRIIDISKDMQSKGISPCNRAVNAIAISHLIKNDVETAQKLIDETEGFKQNVRDRNSLNTALITTYISQGNYDAAEEKFSQLKNDGIVTFGQYKQMFRMCEFKENVLRMEELYEDLISREMKADAFIDEHMIRTYLKNYQAELCAGILERNVQQTRTKMTVDVFMTVIGELVLKPQHMQLLQTAIEITRENFPEVEERRFNEALLIANINTGSFQQAHQYYTNIVEERVEVESEDGEMKKSPNPLNTFKKFASMAARQGNLEIIGKIVMFLKEFNLPPHLVDTPYLEALGKHEEVEKIKSLLEERSNNKVEESKSFSAVLCDLQQKLPV